MVLAVDEYLKTLREATTATLWSRAVELCRKNAVSGTINKSEHLKLSVIDESRRTSARVELFPMDSDWLCDCGSDDDPCLHVLAAAIAVKQNAQSLQDGAQLGKQRSQIRYFLKSVNRNRGRYLSLQRHLFREGKEVGALAVSCVAVANGRIVAPDVEILPIDVKIEEALQLDINGSIKSECAVTLCKIFSELEFLFLDGQKILARSDLYKKKLLAVQHEQGVEIKIIPEPQVQLFVNAFAFDQGVLRAYSPPKLNENDLNRLTTGVTYAQRDLTRLESEVLPSLANSFNLEIKASNLQAAINVTPELVIHTIADGDSLIVQGRIVYGNPPLAMVVDDELVKLGDRLPRRQKGQEAFLSDRFMRKFDFPITEAKRYQGIEAMALADQLAKSDFTTADQSYSNFHLCGALTPNVCTRPGEGVDLTFQGDSGVQAAFNDVWRAYTQSKEHLHIAGKGFFTLPLDWLKEHHTALAYFDSLVALGPTSLNPKLLTSRKKVVLDSLLTTEGGNHELLSIDQEQLEAKLDPLLRRLHADLRPYQLEGVRWLLRHQLSERGCILADDMGLGKTLQTIALFNNRVLVICPRSLLANWQNELRKFRPELSVNVYHSAKRALTSADVTLTTYGTIRQDIAELVKHTWSLVVADEAQYFKNPESGIAQALFQLKATSKFALSGTPVENSVLDLWSLVNFTNLGLLGTLSSFKKIFKAPIEAGNQHSFALLKRLTSDLILRRRKSDVAKDLPPKVEMMRLTSFTDEQAALYRQIYEQARQQVLEQSNTSENNVIKLLEILLRVRQVCCAPQLLPGVTRGESAKLDCIEGIVLEAIANEQKTLVFSQWTSFLDLIAERLSNRQIQPMRLDGRTSDRQGIVDSFQNSAEPEVLLMSLKAGGVGLNLTSADHVIISDPWWNPAAEDQATDRAHRIGRSGAVFVHKIVVEHSIEEKIIQLQEEKRTLAQQILGEDKPGLSTITADDIRQLFE